MAQNGHVIVCNKETAEGPIELYAIVTNIAPFAYIFEFTPNVENATFFKDIHVDSAFRGVDILKGQYAVKPHNRAESK